jgi:altronate dehydratase
MHSPGNDLESVAGQVATGCNLIFFTTGNGAITNFPFVPTIKVVTTSARFSLLQKDMDFNAGRLLDKPDSFSTLSKELFQLSLSAASARYRTAGERATHLPQVSIWRDWKQTSADALDGFCSRESSNLKLALPYSLSEFTCQDKSLAKLLCCSPTESKIALVLPTSLCSSEVARSLALRLTKAQQKQQQHQVDCKFVALPHTEGCGSNYGHGKFEQHTNLPLHAGEAMFDRILVGHLSHPMIAFSLLLEHGCEINHTDRMWDKLRQAGLLEGSMSRRFLRASVQQDGGVDSVLSKCEKLVNGLLGTLSNGERHQRPLRVGFVRALNAKPTRSDEVAKAASVLCARAVLCAGGTAVHLMSGSNDQESSSFFPAKASLRFAESVLDKQSQSSNSGLFYVMECPCEDWLERITGLASAGVDVIIAFGADRPLTGHPFVPLIQLGSIASICDIPVCPRWKKNSEALVDASASCDIFGLAKEILLCVEHVVKGTKETKAQSSGNIGFQIARGPLGVSV